MVLMLKLEKGVKLAQRPHAQVSGKVSGSVSASEALWGSVRLRMALGGSEQLREGEYM